MKHPSICAEGNLISSHTYIAAYDDNDESVIQSHRLFVKNLIPVNLFLDVFSCALYQCVAFAAALIFNRVVISENVMCLATSTNITRRYHSFECDVYHFT